MTIILGAGASGLVTSILLARNKKEVLLIERQERGGKKILASGNGRCNISNIKITKSNFYGNNNQLIDNLIKEYSFDDIKRFFNSIGLELTQNNDGKVFPLSKQAKSVLNLLEAEVKRLKIKTIYGVKNINIDNKLNVKIDDKCYKAKNIILATGSLAAQQLGGNDSGLEIAKQFGHNIIKPLPALVPLQSNNSICKICQGIKIDAKLILFRDNKEITSKIGDLLFAKYGISGLATLDISIDVAKEINKSKNIEIAIDFFYNFSKKELLKFLKSKIDKNRNLPLKLWLNGFINSKISDFIINKLKFDKIYERDLNNNDLKELTQYLKFYKIKIDSLRDFKYAEVAIGGVDTKEINLNFESKKQKGIFFTGEILDTVGQRGGYNFTFAWFSAFRVSNYLSQVLQ